MASESTGVYRYYYAIDSSATYGKHKVRAVATTATGETGIYETEYYVMPWKLERTVRRISGISETKSISDEDIPHISWMSYKEALRDVYNHHYKEAPCYNPDTGVGYDGSNTSFQTKHYPIADINGDGVISGSNVSCATDVTIWWINSAGHRADGIVTVTQEDNGELTITQADCSAIPSSQEGVYLDYWSQYDSYNEYIFQEAVAYLAAHYVVLRFNELDRVTLADLNSNRPIVLANPNRFIYEYRRLINMIREPRGGGA